MVRRKHIREVGEFLVDVGFFLEARPILRKVLLANLAQQLYFLVDLWHDVDLTLRELITRCTLLHFLGDFRTMLVVLFWIFVEALLRRRMTFL